jgi:hypothetical protein
MNGEGEEDKNTCKTNELHLSTDDLKPQVFQHLLKMIVRLCPNRSTQQQIHVIDDLLLLGIVDCYIYLIKYGTILKIFVD